MKIDAEIADVGRFDLSKLNTMSMIMIILFFLLFHSPRPIRNYLLFLFHFVRFRRPCLPSPPALPAPAICFIDRLQQSEWTTVRVSIYEYHTVVCCSISHLFFTCTTGTALHVYYVGLDFSSMCCLCCSFFFCLWNGIMVGDIHASNSAEAYTNKTQISIADALFPPPQPWDYCW